MEVIVRPMKVGDAHRVAALSEQFGHPSTVDQVRTRFRGVSQNADGLVLVAETTRRDVVGWIHVHGRHLLGSDPHAEITGLVVDRRSRRRGIGQALVRAAEGWAMERRYGEIRVRSNVRRTNSGPFYETLGYNRTKTQNVFRRSLAHRG